MPERLQEWKEAFPMQRSTNSLRTHEIVMETVDCEPNGIYLILATH